MKPLYSTAFISLIVVSLSTYIAAQGLDPLARTSTFTPTVSFIESHSEYVITTVDNTDPEFPMIWREIGANESISVTVIANITGINLASLTASTPFSLTLGDLSIYGTLGDDPLYAPGKTTISLPAINMETGKPIGTYGVRLSWSSTRLVITVTGASPLAMPGTVEMANWATTNPSIRVIRKVSLEFGPFTAPDRNVYVSGKCTVTTKSYTTPEPQTLDLVTTSLSGSCEYGVPTNTVTSPLSGSVTGPNATIIGKAIDSFGISTVEYAVNPSSSTTNWTPATSVSIPPPAALWGTTSASWSISLTGLVPGTNTLWVRSTDISGNTSITTAATFVNPLPTPVLGRWDAVMTPTNVSPVRGAVTFSCTANGYHTGKLYLETSTISFTGYTDSSSRIQQTIRRLGYPDLTLTADVLSANGTGVMTGTLADASGNGATFAAHASPYSPTTLSSVDLAGRFHVKVDPPTSVTMGYSYLVVTTTRTGTVTVSGRMADSTPITWSGVLGTTGEIPMFAPIYTTMYLTRGSVACLLKIDAPTHSIPTSTLKWTRPLGATDKQFPPGYSLALPASGSLFDVAPLGIRVMGLPSGAGNALATITGEDVTGTLEQRFTVNTTNTTSPFLPNPIGLSMVAIPRTTGLGVGSFRMPGTTTTAAINYLIVNNQAFGHYVAPALPGTVNKRFGTVTLTAAPSP
ncbi:MAG: hypothetical protein JNM99_22630 [Verrucomicrobiaceae bacterium]|nr:hypothetical protein [Verrucomicrobiaceae bacterium]